MTEDPDQLAARIADRGREEVAARLRYAFEIEAGAAGEGVTLFPDELDQLVAEAVPRAGGTLWRRSLAGAACSELGIELREAVAHPVVRRAGELAGAPQYEPAAGMDEPAVEAESPAEDASKPPAAADAVRLPAVHLGGIEALRAGEHDLELRLSGAGLDVLKRSSGAPIGRLEWSEIREVDLPPARRRGLRRARRAQELHVVTHRGRASFELPGVTEQELKQHLEPMLARARGGSEPAQ